VSQTVHISVQPPLKDRPWPPVRLMDDRARWTMLTGAVAGADKWRIRGSRGVVQDIWFLKPDEVAARTALPVNHPHQVGPTFPGPIVTDVER
jgi:hypothetical protein